MPLKRLQTASAGKFPQLDAAIPASAGQSAPVGGKGQAPHQVAMPGERLHAGSRPGLLPLPQPDAAIKAPASERAFVRAKGEGPDHVRMGLPGQVQGPAYLAPHPYFAPLAARGPVLSAAADGHRYDDVEGLSKDALTQQRPA